MVFSDKKLIGLLVLIFISIAIPRLVFPDLDHGDEYTDANALHAGQNFAKSGFLKYRFLPVFAAQTDTLPQKPYLHFPALPEIINGLLRMIFKTDSLVFFRAVSLALSLVTIVLWYLIIRMLSGSAVMAFLGALFYMTNPSFIYCFDDMQQHHYAELLRAAIVFLYLRILTKTSKNKNYVLLSLWAMFFIMSLVTYEYVPFVVLFLAVGYKIFPNDSEQRVNIKELGFLCSAAVAGFVLHVLQNAWYFGSLRSAIGDLLNIAGNRSFGNYELPASLSLLTWLKYVIAHNLSVVFLFDWFTLLLMLFISYLLYIKLSQERQDVVKTTFRAMAVLLFCGISWYVFFPSHSLAHTFVGFLTKHLTPVASLGFALFCFIVYSFLKESVPLKKAARMFFISIIAVIVASGIKQSQLPVTADKISAARDFLTFRHYLEILKNISRPSDLVGVNYHRFPFMSYYAARNFIVAHDRRMLEEQPVLPEYFIFLPYPAPYTQDLAKFLNEKYTMLFQCPSQRFPAVFLKRKDLVSDIADSKEVIEK
jgi:hypothetical protein